MSASHFIQTIIEIFLILFAIWGMFNEQVLIKFEQKISKLIKIEFKKIKKWVDD